MISKIQKNQFYWSSISMISNKCSNSLPASWGEGVNETNDQPEIGNSFNSFFTNLSSALIKTNYESYYNINNTFAFLSKEKKFTQPEKGFSFSELHPKLLRNRLEILIALVVREPQDFQLRF